MLQRFSCVLEFDVPYDGTVDVEDVKRGLIKRIDNQYYEVKIYVEEVSEEIKT